jgi:hypothetical protein
MADGYSISYRPTCPYGCDATCWYQCECACHGGAASDPAVGQGQCLAPESVPQLTTRCPATDGPVGATQEAALVQATSSLEESGLANSSTSIDGSPEGGPRVHPPYYDVDRAYRVVLRKGQVSRQFSSVGPGQAPVHP